MSDIKKNIEHSVFQRLLNYAKSNHEDFNLLLTRYGMERLLYRLSTSAYSDNFILKGASLFLVWSGQNYRVTRDVDFLGQGNSDMDNLAGIFKELCAQESSVSDGIIFLPVSVKVQEIRKEIKDGGTRITLIAMLHNARIPLQIDVGFGNVITPASEVVEYPTILDAPAPKLMAYPHYTMISEKLSAMVERGLATSRMKDFYDICLVSRLFEFDGKILGQAIRNTFARQNIALPESTPISFTAYFYEDKNKLIQWQSFLRKAQSKVILGELASVVKEISRFISPILNSIRTKNDFTKQWKPEEGWVD